MGIFDDTFRKVFSDKRIFAEFLNIFGKDLGLSHGIREEHLFLEDAIFKDPYFENREADLLYRIVYEDSEVYVYLLVEHQTRVDYLMPLRVLGYMVRIWEFYIKRHKDVSRRKGFKLPPIIPIVFYDGIRRWTAPCEFSEKIKNVEVFKRFTPSFVYELIDVGNIDREKVLGIKDAVSVLLILNSIKKEELLIGLERIKEAIEELPERELELLRSYIGAYIRVLVERTGVDIDMEDFQGEEGEEKMFARFEKVLKEFIEEEREKAIKEGVQEGEVGAKIEIAEKLLMGKFGKDVEGYINNVEKLSKEQLDYIIEHIFNISLEEVKGILKG